MRNSPTTIDTALARVLLSLGLLALPLPSTGDDSLASLRKRQDAEMEALRKSYHEIAQRRVPRTPEGRIDTSAPEYGRVLEDYRAARTDVNDRYRAMDRDGRGLELQRTIDEYKGRIKNTGGKTGDPYGMPKNVQADIDLAADDLDAARDLTKSWAKGNQGKPIEVYTLDNPRQPVKVTPENVDQLDWKRVVKTVDPNNDTTLWTPQTEEIRRAKIEDPDAWTSSGGLKGTGNRNEASDARGFVLDNEGKFLHADRPARPVTGGHDEELKTFSKSLAKAGGASGRTAQNKPLYEQAKTLQEYGDAYEAGIATLGEDTPAQAAKKVEQWKAQAREEFVAAKQAAQAKGDRVDTYREDLARQLRESGERQKAAGRPSAGSTQETAQRMEDRRQRVADSNRDVAAENRKLAAEADEAYGRKPAGSAAPDAPDAPGRSPSTSAAAASSAAGDAADGAKSARPRWDTGPSEVAVIDPGARVKAIDGRKPKAGPDYLGAASTGLETGGQLFERTSRQMGTAVDANRDLNAGDAAAIAKDMVPGVAGYEASQQALLDRQVKRVERQERIRQLEGKAERSLDEDRELVRLRHAQANNPDTALGNANAMAKEGVGSYFDEMEKQARKEGRQKPEFLKDGVPMLGRMAMDAVNAVNPFAQTGQPIAEGAAEQSTFNERADWAGQKVEMTAFVNTKAMQADKRSQRMVSELDALLMGENPSDPANRRRAEALIAAIEANQREIDKLVALANGHLGEVDPKELAMLRGIARSQTSVDALRDYAKQMQGEEKPASTAQQEPSADAGWKEAKAGFTAEHGKEAGWGDGRFEKDAGELDPRIGQIVQLSDRCAYRDAHALATQVLQSDAENAWVKANYPAIGDWAQREQAYHRALGAAHHSVRAGDLEGTVSSLRVAMQNAASRCGQDVAVRQLLDRALALGDSERQAAIERARRDGYRTTYVPQAGGGGVNNDALIDGLTDLLTTINRGARAGSAPTNVQDIYRNTNTKAWDDAAKVKARSNPASSLPPGYRPPPPSVSVPRTPTTTTSSPPARPRTSPSGGTGQGEFSIDLDPNCKRTADRLRCR